MKKKDYQPLRTISGTVNIVRVELHFIILKKKSNLLNAQIQNLCGFIKYKMVLKNNWDQQVKVRRTGSVIQEITITNAFSTSEVIHSETALNTKISTSKFLASAL